MGSKQPAEFIVALTADFFGANGSIQYQDVGQSVRTNQPGISVLSVTSVYVRPEQLQGAHAAILMETGADSMTASDNHSLLALARFGVGYNDIDVKACTKADVLLYCCWQCGSFYGRGYCRTDDRARSSVSNEGHARSH